MSADAAAPAEEDPVTDRISARAAKDGLRAELAPLDGVGGIGIGRRDGGYVVTVDVVDDADTVQVPSTWDGVDVEVRVVGRVRPSVGPVAGRPLGGGSPPGGPVSGAQVPGRRAPRSGVRLPAPDRDGLGPAR